MKRSLSLTCVMVLVVAAACNNGSGSSTDGGSHPVDAGSATVTLTGAVTDSVTVALPTSTFTPSTNQSELDIRASLSGVTTQVAFYFPGGAAATTYTANHDAGIDCSLQIFVNDGGLDGWAANIGGGLPDLGACAVTFTSAALSVDHTTQQEYAVHGSFTATAPAHAGSATGTVSYSAAF